MKCAILDWGIGGLSVLKALKFRNPSLDFVYLSDSGFTPYGKLDPADLKRRVETLFQTAIDQFEAEALIIACNAASTVFHNEQFCHSKPVYNVIDPTLEFLRRSKFHRIGVIGGKRTIDSHIYAKGLPNLAVTEVVAQPLSGLIERGEVSGPVVRKCLEQILEPFRMAPIEALVLACTHYPAVSKEIQTLMPKTELIDPADIVAASLSGIDSPPASKRGTYRSGCYHSTGNLDLMIAAADLAFAMKLPDVNALTIS